MSLSPFPTEFESNFPTATDNVNTRLAKLEVRLGSTEFPSGGGGGSPTDLPAAGAFTLADLIAIAQSPFGAGSDKSITGADLKAFLDAYYVPLAGVTPMTGYLETPFIFANLSDAIVNAASVAGEVSHHSTAGTPTVGNGVAFDYSMDSSTTVRQIGSRVIVDWSDATHATRTARFRIFVTSSAALTELLRLDPTASILFSRLNFGGTSSSFPALRQTGAQLDFVLADNSALTTVSASAYRTDSSNVNVQTGTTYSLQASDNGKVVTLSNANPITLTVPAGLGAGFTCTLIQIGAGQVTVTPSGVTVNSPEGLLKLAVQHSAATLYAYAADVFNLSGSLSA